MDDHDGHSTTHNTPQQLPTPAATPRKAYQQHLEDPDASVRLSRAIRPAEPAASPHAAELFASAARPTVHLSGLPAVALFAAPTVPVVLQACSVILGALALPGAASVALVDTFRVALAAALVRHCLPAALRARSCQSTRCLPLYTMALGAGSYVVQRLVLAPRTPKKGIDSHASARYLCRWTPLDLRRPSGFATGHGADAGGIATQSATCRCPGSSHGASVRSTVSPSTLRFLWHYRRWLSCRRLETLQPTAI